MQMATPLRLRTSRLPASVMEQSLGISATPFSILPIPIRSQRKSGRARMRLTLLPISTMAPSNTATLLPTSRHSSSSSVACIRCIRTPPPATPSPIRRSPPRRLRRSPLAPGMTMAPSLAMMDSPTPRMLMALGAEPRQATMTRRMLSPIRPTAWPSMTSRSASRRSGKVEPPHRPR